MERFWILGAGRFGSLAVERILEHRRNPTLVVVDLETDMLDELRGFEVEIIVGNAIDFLLEQPGVGSEWVVPAIPMHVAFAWLSKELVKEAEIVPVDVPLALVHRVPNPVHGKDGSLCTSLATFRCPDNCEEPEERCSVTGEQRQGNLFDLIRTFQLQGYLTLVIRSHQLAPGVGGYRLSALWRLLKEARSTDKSIIVATACRCHGIVNALRWERSA
jgi:hypothetical protein